MGTFIIYGLLSGVIGFITSTWIYDRFITPLIEPITEPDLNRAEDERVLELFYNAGIIERPWQHQTISWKVDTLKKRIDSNQEFIKAFQKWVEESSSKT